MSASDLARGPLRAIFSCDAVVRRAAFEIRQNHFGSLGISVPLSHGFKCPIHRASDLIAFSEMFVLREYGTFLRHMPVPRRWLDLGCHLGFFTLYLSWHLAALGFHEGGEGLLVDADSGIVELAKRTLSENSLESRFTVMHGAISERKTEVDFQICPFMASSMSPVSLVGGRSVKVPVLDQEEILNLFPPPYDLLKLDIEGAETDFLQSYGSVFKETRYVLLEWHTWNQHQWDEAAINEAVKGHAFELAARIKESASFTLNGTEFRSGVDLYRRLR